MKVVHLTSVHGPFDVRIFHKECKSLVQAGHKVVLIAPYQTDSIVDGIHIKAVRLRRKRLARITLSVCDVFWAALNTKADLYHLHDPELLPVGIILALLGRKVIYDVHEDVPKDILGKSYLHPVVRRPLASMVRSIEQLCSRCFYAVIAVTPNICDRLCKFNRRTITVYNFPRIEELRTGGSTASERRTNSVAYVGGIMEDRGILQMIDAVALLPSVTLELAHPEFPSDLYKTACTKPGWTRVQDHGHLDRAAIAHLLGTVRAGLVLFHPLPNNVAAMPHKMFEYMAAGLPVIASDFPEWRKVIGSLRCGILVNPLDPKAIADAILYILDNPLEARLMGQAGRDAVERDYNWQAEERKLLDLYCGCSSSH